jgi:hypothetical protein
MVSSIFLVFAGKDCENSQMIHFDAPRRRLMHPADGKSPNQRPPAELVV